MTSAAILGSLLIAAGEDDDPEQAALRPVTEDTISARSVNRGLEEPGRYAPANLFDGDAETAYCSAPRSGWAQVLVDLSDADRALLRKVKSLRITPSRTFSGLRLDVWLGTGDAGSGGGHAEVTIGTTVETLAVAKSTDSAASGSSIIISLHRADPRHDRLPLCLAEIALLGPGGRIKLPDLSRAVKANMKRDAELARLTADRAAFARAYMTSFTWTLRNPHKEHSDWESSFYRFLPDGTYESTTRHLDSPFPDRPLRMTGRWSIGKNGKSVLFNGKPDKLVPCAGSGGYLCVGSDLFFPDVAR